MEKTNRFTSFYDGYEDDFIEHLDSVKVYLEKGNGSFKNIQKEYLEILNNNKNLQNFFYGNVIEEGLTSDECRLLSKLINLQDEMQIMAEKELYFKGGMDAYFYFCKLGIIKNTI